ncbi:MAG: hypothetical protein U0V74_03860 [Chitinophagales bacterium]
MIFFNRKGKCHLVVIFIKNYQREYHYNTNLRYNTISDVMINLVDKNIDKNGLQLAWLSSLQACNTQLLTINEVVNRFRATEWLESRLAFLNHIGEDGERLSAEIKKLELEMESAHQLFPETNGNKVLGFTDLLKRNSLRNKTRQLEQSVFYLRFRLNQFLDVHDA